MNHFPEFAALVDRRYEQMRSYELFVVDTSDLFETYLQAFPEGTNPLFRERTEHDCSCCKQFIRNIGNVVALIDGQRVTVWDDYEKAPHPYNEVGRVLAERVRQAPIKSVWRTRERRYGVSSSNELLPDGTVRTWDHFAGAVRPPHYNAKPDSARGSINTTVAIFRRGLEEITPHALQTVVELAEANTLYRGAEFLPSVRAFQGLKAGYDSCEDRDQYAWANVGSPATRVRNTAIGTLLLDLSSGVELEEAVRRYERVVAPSNYKRPTALVTEKMVTEAVARLDELGLRSAVERRHARIEDVSVNDVLFVDNEVAGRMKDSLVEDLLSTTKRTEVRVKDAEDISAEDFFTNIVPRATTISALVEGRHRGNFVSLTAPVSESTGRLFAWDNDFSWSYDGDVADSIIKQRVKAAGGDVEAQLRVSLAWFNTDDLDIHANTPAGDHIYFGNKLNVLDVDMNVRNPVTDPVENLSWRRVDNGVYKISVEQFTKRNSHDVGFTIEVEMNGRVQQYRYERAVINTVVALHIVVENGEIVDIRLGNGVMGGGFSLEKWGVKTETLVPVDTLMLSPNHWGDQRVGNRHWLFMLRGCLNPDPVRGIYNEYLRPELSEHRKVFEVLGSKTKAPYSDSQLSGLGFSSTQRNSLTVVVRGPEINRAFNIQF